MNEFRLKWAVAAAILGAVWLLGRASGDDVVTPAAATADKIATVDVGRIFLESPRLTRLRDEMQHEMQRENKSIDALVAELKQLKADYDAAEADSGVRPVLEADLKKKTEEFNELRKKVQSEFAAREAETYATFYDDVVGEVETQAKIHGISFVMRTKSNEMPSEFKGEESMKQMVARVNQLFVYSGGLDLTDAVIEGMKDAEAF